jgi:nitroimidazol reductase NimA-like FMN-containing flavoprotein (pyridoxamine 5'-phosphate oxidase superfamily)
VSASRPAKFSELTREECNALLARNHAGRIAFSYHDHVDIEPINFVYEKEWIYGRTAEGTKLRTLAHNRWVAFETDEIAALFDWQSVVVKGALYLMEPGGTNAESYDHAVAVLRTLNPDLFGDDDPARMRKVLFRIHADQVTGRRATTQE